MIESTVNGVRKTVTSKGMAQKKQHMEELETLIERSEGTLSEKRILNDYHRIYYNTKQSYIKILKDPYILRDHSHQCAYACVESLVNKSAYNGLEDAVEGRR